MRTGDARFRIDFSPGWSATAVVTRPDVHGADLVRRLALPRPRAVLVLNGDTSAEACQPAQLVDVIVNGLALTLLQEGWSVVTGATDAGVFSLLGRAAAARGNLSAPWIGCAPHGLVTWPERVPPRALNGSAALEPHHSHFVLVDGDAWGDETPAMLELAASLASDGTPTAAVVAGGGAGTIGEVLGHAEAGRPIICLDGSGRYADRLAAAAATPSAADDELAALVRSADVVPFSLTAGPSALAGLLHEVLGR